MPAIYTLVGRQTRSSGQTNNSMRRTASAEADDAEDSHDDRGGVVVVRRARVVNFGADSADPAAAICHREVAALWVT